MSYFDVFDQLNDILGQYEGPNLYSVTEFLKEKNGSRELWFVPEGKIYGFVDFREN